MRPCPYCGHEVLKSERYCPNCGRIRKAPISLDKYSLGMIENFKQCFVYKYADFEGRASRSEYLEFLFGVSIALCGYSIHLCILELY